MHALTEKLHLSNPFYPLFLIFSRNHSTKLYLLLEILSLANKIFHPSISHYFYEYFNCNELEKRKNFCVYLQLCYNNFSSNIELLKFKEERNNIFLFLENLRNFFSSLNEKNFFLCMHHKKLFSSFFCLNNFVRRVAFKYEAKIYVYTKH